MSRSKSKRRPARRWLRAGIWIVLSLLVVTASPVLAMRWWDPFTSAFMLQSRMESAPAGDRDRRLRYDWVDLEHISPQAAIAVVAAEDQFFPRHHGFDFFSIRKAMLEGSAGKRVRGASTISQQVAKNLFLWPGRSLLRKGLEAWFTVLIETLWPKERILEVYLNIAQFGPGLYGVQTAAHSYFGKSAAQLTRQEAALLAAVLPNPLKLKVDSPSPYVRSRQQWIMGQMQGLGGPAYLRRRR